MNQHLNGNRRPTDQDPPPRPRAREQTRTPPPPWTVHRRSGQWTLYANGIGLWAIGDGEAWWLVPGDRVDWWLGEFGLVRATIRPVPAARGWW